ncbi:ABC transporter ATP-binding protein [Oceanirhabdus sp. W0125-5]|uniref:ABC transporter ATP-binding protein n=1 Tax=Oceanirhabdus sp. W0125-5 TaxID=2999116 RepID=UPI0022F2E19B|nr:ABC transporter ATP-binding protein [Oceanirhabdus sp. W0125-5]WBW99671.1 ABC transporter ATP-binding protein [Oceanirhabdus sp. W0125-5]
MKINKKLNVFEYFKLLRKYLKKQKGSIILLCIIMIVTILLELVNPQIMGEFIDGAKEGKGAEGLLMFAILFIIFAFCKQILAIASTYMAQNIGWISTNNLRIDLMEHCLGLDMSFHKGQKTGELIERIDGDITALFNFFSKFIIKILGNIILIMGILIVMFIKSPLIGFVTFILVLCAFKVFSMMQKIAVGKWKTIRKKNAELYGIVGEFIASTEDIKSSGAVNYVLHSFHNFINKFFPFTRDGEMMYMKMWGTSIVIFTFVNISILGLGGWLFVKGDISIGTLYVLFHYSNLIARPIENIRREFQDLQKAGASIKRIDELLAVKSKLDDGIEVLKNKDKISLTLKDVYFGYDEGENVLEEINFSLESGKILGVLGRTGSGKTTLARLIVRLYDITGGNIKLNNQEVRDIKLQEIRNKIAYVTQDVQLFQGTIRENITLFDKSIDDEVIYNIIDDIGLRKWLDNLPDGLNTMLSSEGSGLSAGESQLIAFIRVFLKNPSLVILDEASSRLDPATEDMMENALNKLLKNRTCIIIAHRLSTIKRADEILILEKGKILEYGDRMRLLKDKDSRLSELYKYGIEEVLV